ncbi:MAG: acyl-CoA dehydrogenase, partial [Bacillota bacterium]
MAEQFASKRNIKFMLYEVFNAEELTQYEYFQDHSRETFDMIIDTMWKIGTDFLYPLFQELDKNPPQFVDGQAKVNPATREFMRMCGEGGWINANWSYENGGQQVPVLITFVNSLIMAAANCGLSGFPALTTGAANLILNFGSQELKDLYLEKMVSGEWQGTMALTEPDAGSSLADIKTTAEDTGQGYYKIKGQKIFFSAGDTDATDNPIHLMLAKIKGAPAGVKGISLFVVPKFRFTKDGGLERNDIWCSGIEHKMGFKGSPICTLNMGENNDCHGYLVGQPHMGLSYMFQMMNEARIGVGIAAVGKATAAYYDALEYTKQRLQGRKANQKDPTTPQVPLIEHADIRRMLLFQRAVCEGGLSLALQLSKYVDLSEVGVDKEKHDLLVDFLVPIVKSFPAEYGILSTSAAMQCLGGYGYCQDFPVEQHFRDVRIDPIHEGTTGIQAQDLLGRKTTMKNGAAYKLFMEEARKTIAAASEIPEIKPQADILANGLEVMDDVTSYLLGVQKEKGAEEFLADATLYLEMAGLLAIGWQWLLQGVVAHNALQNQPSEGDTKFYRGKLITMKYFFTYEIPKINGLAHVLKTSQGLTA